VRCASAGAERREGGLCAIRCTGPAVGAIALESQCSPWHSQQRHRHKARAQLQPDRTALATAGGQTQAQHSSTLGRRTFDVALVRAQTNASNGG
jgi:hypothetical protein